MLDKSLSIAVFCLMLVLVLLVTLQVVSRFVFSSPLSWSEEASSLTQIFLVFLGGALAIFRKKTLRITVLIERLPVRVGIYIGLILDFLAVIFLLAVIYYTSTVAFSLKAQFTAALRIPKNYIFYSLILGSALMLVATLRDLKSKISELKST
jgi:TRAP-type transport system small permease protein